MESLMIYLVKANVLFTVLFVAYLLFFRNEKMFTANRGFLLCTLVLTLALPLAPSASFFNAAGLPDYVRKANPLGAILAGTSSAGPIAQVNIQQANGGLFSDISPVAAAMVVYLLVVWFFVLRVIFQLVNLRYLYKSCETSRADGFVLCRHDRKLSPFSFFNILFINPYGDHQYTDQVIGHERVHMRQWHSADVLFTELASALLWINPLMIWFKRYTKLNLEYIADEGVLATGIDKKQYQLNLLYNSVGEKAYPLTNLFNSSKLKLRIKMINQSKKTGWYKYLLVLPLVLVGYLLINPNAANSAGLKVPAFGDTLMKAFEGFYQNQDQPTACFKVTAEGDKLIAKRLDFVQQFTLSRTGDLTFKGTGEQEKMAVTFTKNDAGQITEARVDNKHPWIKVNEYKPVAVVQLTPEQLKAFEGKYEFASKPGVFLTLTVEGSSLTLHSLWDDKETKDFVPISDHEVLNIQQAFDLKFETDSSGKVTKMVAFNSDTWNKVN